MMKRYSLLLLCALLFIGCKKNDQIELPENVQEMMLGQWELKKFKSKTYRRNMQIGGERIDTEQYLTIDSTTYQITDDLGDVISAGDYEVIVDSIFFFDADSLPNRFFIQKLTNAEFELLETQWNDSRIGELRSTGLYAYER